MGKYEEKLKTIGGGAHVLSPMHEQAKMEVFVGCADDLIETLNSSSKSADKLGRKVFWLNVILTIISILGVVYTIASFYKS